MAVRVRVIEDWTEPDGDIRRTWLMDDGETEVQTIKAKKKAEKEKE